MDNSFYAGYTIDLVKRIDQHNNGTGAKYTRPLIRRPVELIHSEAFTSRSEAMKKEYAFKQLTRQEKEKYIATADCSDNVQSSSS